MINPAAAHRRRPPRHQHGSAYLLTLLAIVVLTIAGLSASLVTQTEQQLSANERTMQESFYAADSGMSVATAKMMWRKQTAPFNFRMNHRQREGDIQVASRVRVSAMSQISDPAPCNLCEVNQGSGFFAINHAVTAFAERLTWQGTGPPDDDAPVVGRRKLAKMVELQPWQKEGSENVFVLSDSDLKVEF